MVGQEILCMIYDNENQQIIVGKNNHDQRQVIKNVLITKYDEEQERLSGEIHIIKYASGIAMYKHVLSVIS